MNNYGIQVWVSVEDEQNSELVLPVFIWIDAGNAGCVNFHLRLFGNAVVDRLKTNYRTLMEVNGDVQIVKVMINARGHLIVGAEYPLRLLDADLIGEALGTLTGFVKMYFQHIFTAVRLSDPVLRFESPAAN